MIACSARKSRIQVEVRLNVEPLKVSIEGIIFVREKPCVMLFLKVRTYHVGDIDIDTLEITRYPNTVTAEDNWVRDIVRSKDDELSR